MVDEGLSAVISSPSLDGYVFDYCTKYSTARECMAGKRIPVPD
jgi:hypothetical protein